MAKDVSEAIQQIIQERNISEDLALQIVENTLLAAYKRKFGSSDNAVVRFDDDNRMVSIHAKKKIVDGVFDPVSEIELEEARSLNPEAEEGDEILLELDPPNFGRVAVQSAKQTANQYIRDIRKDSLYAEFKDKEGEIIIGYYQRERNGGIYVDLGKIEGFLPKKFQSPREIYQVNDRIRAIICKVEKTETGLQVILSRSHSDFVRALFEQEVPEVYDKTVEIHKIVREAGYRTKLAVYSTKDDVDPVGACVGLKGVRIQTIIRELEGEKIDVLKYDPDPQTFIKNALSPADVREIIILDEGKHQALAVVNENQLSLAIGKQGQNVRLANRLSDWNIDVKTVEQFEEMGLYSESRKAVSRLFGDEDYGDVIEKISELPNVDAAVASILSENGIDLISDFLDADDERLGEIEGLSAEQIAALRLLVAELDEFVEQTEYEAEEETEEAAAETAPETSPAEAPEPEAPAEAAQEATETDDDEEVYECPECGSRITTDMTKCPKCGIEISFEYEE